MKKIRKHPESYKALWVLSLFHRYSDYKHITPYRNNSGVFVCVRFGASVLTELNEKHSKIKGFRQSINGINLKIKYFSLQNTLRY